MDWPALWEIKNSQLLQQLLLFKRFCIFQTEKHKFCLFYTVVFVEPFSQYKNCKSFMQLIFPCLYFLKITNSMAFFFFLKPTPTRISYPYKPYGPLYLLYGWSKHHIYTFSQSDPLQSHPRTHLSMSMRQRRSKREEQKRKVNVLLSSVPLAGSCGSCRPLLLFAGVSVGLVWADPPRGCALTHRKQKNNISTNVWTFIPIPLPRMLSSQ